MPETIRTINYGGNGNVSALQVTTGLYPSSDDTPIDVREKVQDRSILTSNTPVGCKLYVGLEIYVEETKETVTAIGLYDGCDGSMWNHWIFDYVCDEFKNAIDDCRNINNQGRYDSVNPGVYTTQNLLNYLFLRGGGGPTQEKYQLRIDYVYSNGGSVREPYINMVSAGSDYSVQSPSVSGYSADIENVNGTMPDTDVNITVTYSICNYQLSYKISSSGQPVHTVLLPYHGLVSYYTPDSSDIPSGKEFAGWNYSPGLDNGGLMPASDVTAEAQLNDVQQTFNVTVLADPQNGGTITGAGTYDSGSNVTLSANPSSGFVFKKWIDNGTLNEYTEQPLIIQGILRDYDITAAFRQTSCNVTIHIVTTPDGVGGGVTGGGTVPFNQSMTVTANPNPGFKFNGWYNGDQLMWEGEVYQFRVTSDIDLTCNFIKVYDVDVTVNPIGTGTVTGAGKYRYGDRCSLLATANSGYSFQNWTIDGTAYSDNPLDIPSVTSDISVTSNFVQVAPVNVYGFTSISPDISNVDLTGKTYTSVSSDQTDSVFYSNIDTVFGTNYLYYIAAIPETFMHGSVETDGDFFMTEGTGYSVESFGVLNHNTVQFGGTSYLVVVSQAIDLSELTGGSITLMFGNVDENKTITENLAVAHQINLR